MINFACCGAGQPSLSVEIRDWQSIRRQEGAKTTSTWWGNHVSSLDMRCTTEIADGTALFSKGKRCAMSLKTLDI